MDSLKRAGNRLRGRGSGSGGADDEDPSSTGSNAVFNKDAPLGSDSNGSSLKTKVKKVAHATIHPQQAAKEAATKQIVANERPWAEDQVSADKELFDAHDELDEARDKKQSGHADGELQERDARSRLQDVANDREELQVAWHMSRYVHRVRAVRRPVECPPKARYRRYDSNGKYVGFNWAKYAGHLSYYACQDAALQYVSPTNEVSYDRAQLIRNVERLLVASEAFQLWWMRVRRVYTWEDPWLTFKWLIVYFVLLRTGYFMSFYYAYLLYSCVTNFYGKHSRTWMRESHHRATKTQERAAMISELIMRHGSDGWLDAFLEEIGPWLQLQVGDLADFLEIASNYYDWRNVSATTASCFNYVALFLICAVPSLEWSIKVFWLSCGLYFFLSRPIATVYPRFRHVVNPVRWMYWDSPTLSEQSFAYLRVKARASPDCGDEAGSSEGGAEVVFGDDCDNEIFFDCVSKAAPTSRVRSTGLSSGPVMSFPARWNGQRGHLQLFRSFARFATISRIADTFKAAPQAVVWERSLADILEVRKANQPPSSFPRSLERKPASAALSILWATQGDPEIATTEEMPNEGREEDYFYGFDDARRDEAFNLLIGLSDMIFQELQPEQDQKR